MLTAAAGLEGRGHVIITDNFFTSPRLFMELMKRGFWATRTCQKTRKGFLASLAGFVSTQLPERGHLEVKMHRSCHITAICWMDAKPVFLRSTACDPIGEDSYAGRWMGRERVWTSRHLQFFCNTKQGCVVSTLWISSAKSTAPSCTPTSGGIEFSCSFWILSC